MKAEFKLSDYWQGESHWSKNELPKLLENICKSPLARRIIITGPIGVGKSRLSRIMAAYIRFYRNIEKNRRILLQQYNEGFTRDPHSGIPETSIDHFSSINVATLPVDTGLAELFGIAPGFYSDVEGNAGLFEKVIYKNKENSFYKDFYEIKDKGDDPEAYKDGDKDIITGGIVFLDEIADAHPLHQTALLKVVSEGSFHRQGSGFKVEHFDGIIICATWRNLETPSKKKLNESNKKKFEFDFRPDLLSRFEGAAINIPPLSERTEDIIPHAMQICREINTEILHIKEKQCDTDRTLRSTEFIESIEGYLIGGDGIGRGRLKFDDFSDAIQTYTWNRGNARELRTAIERYVTAKGRKPMKQIIAEITKNFKR